MIDELQIKPITQKDINILPSYLRTDQELETKLNRVLYELGKLNQEGSNIALPWCTDHKNGLFHLKFCFDLYIVISYIVSFMLKL